MEQLYLVWRKKRILEPWCSLLEWVGNNGLERKLEESVFKVSMEGQNGMVAVNKFTANSKNSETVAKAEHICIVMAKNIKPK